LKINPCDIILDIILIKGTEKEYLSNMKAALKETEKKKPEAKYLKQLLRESHIWRREEIEKFNKDNLPMVSTLLDKWPCLKYGLNVSYCSRLDYMKSQL